LLHTTLEDEHAELEGIWVSVVGICSGCLESGVVLQWEEGAGWRGGGLQALITRKTEETRDALLRAKCLHKPSRDGAVSGKWPPAPELFAGLSIAKCSGWGTASQPTPRLLDSP
jgi:hypothetical protein